jgi:hypothetical protein
VSAETPGNQQASARSDAAPIPASPADWTGQAAADLSTEPIGRAPAVTAGLYGGWRPRSRRPVVLAGVAVVALLAGASAALEVTSSTPASHAVAPRVAAAANGPSSRQVIHRAALPGARRFGLGRPAIAGGLLRALHGEFVVARPGGGYQTVAIQNGEVTAVSGTSIKLRSADGYTRSYVVTKATMVNARRSGISSVRPGNEVIVIATVSGGRATAVRMADLTLLQRSRQLFGYPG